MKTGFLDRIRAFFSSLFNRRPAEGEGDGRPEPVAAVKLTRPFTFIDGCGRNDPILREILQEDLRGMETPLQLMKSYADVLNREASHRDIDDKLDRLFLCGRTPPSLDGYYHGITLSLKTGTDLQQTIERMRSALGIGKEIDPFQILYGRLLSRTSPWAGKNFRKLEPKKLGELTDGSETGEVATYLGINSFRRANKDIVNNLAGQVLSLVIEMEGVPRPERKQRSWIYAKGGLFIAKRQKSVGPEHPDKEVIGLNYRWKNLGNELPNKLLIDEIVQIAEGLYLGKLFYATSVQHMLKDFDPNVRVEDYKYRNFGYFLLMDDTWLHEKNGLFPELAYRLADDLPAKFSAFQLVDSPASEKIRNRLSKGKTVLHALQDLSNGVKEGTEAEEKFFQEIHQLFLCGQRPDGIRGFLHGGVVAFQSSGCLKKLGTNVLNNLWPTVRPFSPWTGKTFTDTTVERIRKYIGQNAERYRGVAPIILGTNTYRKELDLSLPATAFIERLTAIGMAVESPNEEEKEKEIFMKSFFFIASHGRSVNPACEGKEVLLFNYRWPELHTMPPDNLCIDELVRIADGLYLGQLLYSTAPGIEYSPDRDPADYRYENFGYFMLMDDDWWAIKELISFDTEK